LLHTLLACQIHYKQQQLAQNIVAACSNTVEASGHCLQLYLPTGTVAKCLLLHTAAATVSRFGDPDDRVRWRSKQNLDYAALMEYAAPLGRHYLQVQSVVKLELYYC
jgi:N-Acetylglucosaminyltransferase-IV (GnT-IV) conserved region